MFDWLRNLRKTEQEKHQERITAYLDGALAPQERTTFERELARDEPLRIEVEAQRQVKQLLSQLPPLQAPRNFTLDPALYGERESEPYPYLRVAMTAATVLVVAFASLTVLNNSQRNVNGVFTEVNSSLQADSIASAPEFAPADESPADIFSAILPDSVTESEEAEPLPPEAAQDDMVEEAALEVMPTASPSSQLPLATAPAANERTAAPSIALTASPTQPPRQTISPAEQITAPPPRESTPSPPSFDAEVTTEDEGAGLPLAPTPEIVPNERRPITEPSNFRWLTWGVALLALLFVSLWLFSNRRT